MMMQVLIEANSLRELQTAIRSLAARQWEAKAGFYLTYDDSAQSLRYREHEWPLSSETQPGCCALDLRIESRQDLPWPEELTPAAPHRIAYPIFNWGSLIGVLCLGFEQDPGELLGFDDFAKSLGVLGARVAQNERAQIFVDRCKEHLVRAVETRGAKGHIERCCRLAQAIAGMLDCSAQVQADLSEAAQYHDVGMLSFSDPRSPEAIREHTLVGANLLRTHPDFAAVADLVESHHERYDGSGQPHGKSGDELPLECWILALAENVVESWEESLATYEMKVKEFFAGPAKHHHPDVVDALCGLVDSGKLPDLLD